MTGLLDWVKDQVKDKAGVFVLGLFFGGVVVYSFYKSEKTVREFIEKENERLINQVQICKDDRRKDRENFLGQMKELYHFSEELKEGFREVEEKSRKIADEKRETLKNR